MGRGTKTGALARKTIIEESRCERCGREFRTRDKRLGVTMLKLHLQKEHNISADKIKLTNHGHVETTLNPQNSNGHLPWEHMETNPVHPDNPN